MNQMKVNTVDIGGREVKLREPTPLDQLGPLHEAGEKLEKARAELDVAVKSYGDKRDSLRRQLLKLVADEQWVEEALHHPLLDEQKKVRLKMQRLPTAIEVGQYIYGEYHGQSEVRTSKIITAVQEEYGLEEGNRPQTSALVGRALNWLDEHGKIKERGGHSRGAYSSFRMKAHASPTTGGIQEEYAEA